LVGYEFKADHGNQQSFCLDSVVVSLPDFSFVVRSVPKELGPSWSQNLAIDYSKKFSSIPSEETREAIAELVGFIIGRRLIDIGDTTFAEEDVPVLLRSWNPRGINIRALCSQMDFPPCPIDPVRTKSALNPADLLKDLAPRYLKLRRLLDLDHALWRYWTFQEMPSGINLPMIVNAMEILAAGWFSSEFSPSRGKFVSGKFFNELLAEDFRSIRAKLSDAATKEGPASGLSNSKSMEAVMRRIGDSFQMGWSARMAQFFLELGLELSSEQRAALKARNEQTHAFADAAEEDVLWKHAELLRTLFHKVVLRLLDYSGVYLDYAEQYPVPKKLNPTREHNEAFRQLVSP
jgi:hypothetical protein